ncbi:MAG: hypothetical protein J5781_04200, partial [Clostridia bacterium]|nr:hypothetical protein [Clostridia bacterium]
VSLCVIADVILVAGFAFWLSIAMLKAPTVKRSVVFSVIFTAAVCILGFVPATIYHAVASNASVSYFLGMGMADLAIIFSFIFGWCNPDSKNFKQALIATIALLCALVIVISCYVSTIPKADPMSNVVSKFSVRNDLPEGNGKKLKVILLNGQSNASGVSRVACLTEEQRNKYANGINNVHINYFCDNGNNNSAGYFTLAGLNQGYNDGFFGPELGIADALSSSEEEYLILKYTWGGTVLATQWFAPQENGSVGPLYTAFINFTTTYMEYLKTRGYDAKIGAMCWMQGESDSVDENWTKNYLKNTSDFVASLRSDLSAYADEGGIRYIDAGISDSIYWTRYKRVNDAKKQYAADPNNNAVYIDTIAAGLQFNKEPAGNPDLAHYDAASELRLGQLFGEKILQRWQVS